MLIIFYIYFMLFKNRINYHYTGIEDDLEAAPARTLCGVPLALLPATSQVPKP